MPNDDVFRWLTLGLVAAALPVGLFFRLRSHTGERLDRRAEGWLLVPLRLCGVCFMLGTLAFVIDPGAMAWASLGLPAWLRWAGVGVAATALPLMVWVMATLGRNITDTVAIRQSHTLVTSGPYRWVRHPFYAVGFLWFVGLTLVTGSAWLAVAGLAALTMLAVRTPIEERKLVERFGDEYRAYMRRTGRFWPRLVSQS